MQNWIPAHTPQEQDEFTAGMIAADEYRLGRDTPAKRISPAVALPEVSSIERFDQTITKLTPPVLKLTGLLAVMGVIGGTAVAGVSAVFAVVTANAGAVAGVILAVAAAVLAVAGAKGVGGEKSEAAGKQSGNPQNIIVTVNVAGNTVATNQK